MMSTYSKEEWFVKFDKSFELRYSWTIGDEKVVTTYLYITLSLHPKQEVS